LTVKSLLNYKINEVRNSYYLFDQQIRI
jgi:hypothetical protein